MPTSEEKVQTNCKFEEYSFYMNQNINGIFHICICVVYLQ